MRAVSNMMGRLSTVAEAELPDTGFSREVCVQAATAGTAANIARSPIADFIGPPHGISTAR